MTVDKKAKEPWLAVFLSSIIPGIGQIYSQRRLRGAILVFLDFSLTLIFILSLLYLVFNEDAAINPKNIILTLLPLLVLAAVGLFSLFDSHKCAWKFNEAHGLNVDMQRPKSPWLAVFFSTLLPGLGQLYNRQKIKGILFIVFWFAISEISEIFFLFFLNTAFTVFVLCDAFRVAERMNGRQNSLLKQTNPIAISLIIVWWLILGLPYPGYVKANVVEAFKIPTGAMQPTIMIGDRILVNKRFYDYNEPQRGDIIVFKGTDDSKKDYIKRVVGLPGESIEIKGGRIYINSKELKAPAKISKIDYYNKSPYGAVGQIVDIPLDSYYVLGDNSESSRDSRYFGFVKRDAIIGKAYKIYYPLERSGKIEE